MKKLIFSTLLLSAILSSCKNTNETPQKTLQTQTKEKSMSSKKIDLLSLSRTSGLQKFKLRQNGETREDIIEFYNGLSKRYTNPDELQALQSLTASFILNEYGFLSVAGKENLPAIEKYVDVIRASQDCRPEVYVKIIKTMRRFWDEEKVNTLKNDFSQVAESKRAKMEANIAKFQQMINSPETSIKDKKASMVALPVCKKYIESIDELKNM